MNKRIAHGAWRMAFNALAFALYIIRHALLIMAKFRFKDLEIWQIAIEIADKLFDIAEK